MLRLGAFAFAGQSPIKSYHIKEVIKGSRALQVYVPVIVDSSCKAVLVKFGSVVFNILL